MFGDYNYNALSNANRLLGWMWLFGFSWTAIIILLNFFVAILCEVYAQVMEEYEGIEHVSLMDSVVTKIKRLLVSSRGRPRAQQMPRASTAPPGLGRCFDQAVPLGC